MNKTLLLILCASGVSFAQGQLLYNNASRYGLSLEGLRTSQRPGGGYYSEVQPGNMIAGYRGSVTGSNNDRLADDFVVSGSTWNVTGLSLFMYQTDVHWASVTGGLFEIHEKTSLNTVGDTVASGTFQDSTLTDIYRIFNGQPSDSRQLQRVDVSFDAKLTPGNYYLVWAAKGVSQYQGPWTPHLTKSGYITLPGADALQSFNGGATWDYILDGTKRQEFPFWIYGTDVQTQGHPFIAPEPMSMTAMALGLLAFVRRRR